MITEDGWLDWVDAVLKMGAVASVSTAAAAAAELVVAAAAAAAALAAKHKDGS